VWCLHIAWRLGLYEPKKIETFLDIDRKYIDPLKTKFAKTFESSINYNENISPIFYDKKEYNEYMQTTNTELEKIWKTRIIFEHTPRGNIMMFYDAYKMGFSFYSDEKTISYDILNAAASKYVSMYRCRDFFIDESMTPVSSPFIKLYFVDEPKKQVNNAAKDTFARMKRENPNAKALPPNVKTINQNGIPVAKPNEKKEQERKEQEKKEQEKMKNKFLYLGKMQNSQWTQSLPKKRKVLAKFTSPLLESIKMDAGVQRETLSYKDFKNTLKKITPVDTNTESESESTNNNDNDNDNDNDNNNNPNIN
jgi:hypothetical protein